MHNLKKIEKVKKNAKKRLTMEVEWIYNTDITGAEAAETKRKAKVISSLT
ncbi:MAG: hypothetical protein ACPGXY_01420 [Alphaproteobacteria bacterium]